MESAISVPNEVQLEVLKRLPLATKLELRLVCRHFNRISVAAMELQLVWTRWSRVLLDRHSNNNRNTSTIRIQSVDDLRQSQLAARVFSLRIFWLQDGDPLQTIEQLAVLFEEALQRRLDLELDLSRMSNLTRHYLTSLVHEFPVFRLANATVTFSPTVNRQQSRLVSNYFLHEASRLQTLELAAHDLAGIHIVPPEWSFTLTTLCLQICDPVNGAACIQLMTSHMRNLRTTTLDIQTQLSDKGFFKPLVNLPELRHLAIGDGEREQFGFRCEFPVFARPLRNLQTLELHAVARLPKNPNLFKRMPNLQSLAIHQDMPNSDSEHIMEADCRELVDILIDNCHAASLPNLERLTLVPFLGRLDFGAEEPFFVQSPTLDFDIARILMAAAKCPKLAFLFLDSGYEEINCDVLLPSFEQCPVDYLLASPRAVQVAKFKLEHFLAEPQLLLDYAIGMVRTGLRRLTLKVRSVGDWDLRLAQRAELQEIVSDLVRLLSLDVPKLSDSDIFRKTIHLDAQRFSETIVFIERDCGRKHELCLTTMKNN